MPKSSTPAAHREYRKLHAEWYVLASSENDDRRELEFWARQIRRSGEPVLELGSGTGRVLVPLLEQGFDIVGVDTSDDMVAWCRSAGRAKGLKPRIYRQSMLKLDLPRKFGLIMLTSGGLGLFTEDRDIRELFGRVHAQLKPGGTFIYEFEPVRRDCSDGRVWRGDWLRGPDGRVLAWRRNRRYDAGSHVWQTVFIIDKFVDGKLVESEVNDRAGRNFTVREAVRFARDAGFEHVRATDWLTDRPPSRRSKAVTVLCRRSATLTPRPWIFRRRTASETSRARPSGNPGDDR